MNKKYLAILLILIISIFATGCINYEVNTTINSSENTGNIVFRFAYNETITGKLDAQDSATIEKQYKDIEENLGNFDYTAKDIKYEKDGYKFKGREHKINFSDASLLFNNPAVDMFKRTKVNDTTYRIEMNPYSKENDEIDYEEAEDMLGLMANLGAEITYSLSTDLKITKHNADEVKNNTYIWHLMDDYINQNKTIPFIEYKSTNSEFDKNVYEVLKEKVITIFELDVNDPDFYGKALNSFNILYGTDKGLDLDSELLRLQGALIYARLLGLDDEIEQFKITNPKYKSGFTDVPNWAEPTMNYLHYKKLVYGIGNNKYGSYNNMTENEFTALVLRALGYYEKNGDFVFTEAANKAKQLGFYNSDIKDYKISNQSKLLRRDMSYIAFNSLFVSNKQNATLIENILSSVK